MNSITNIPCKGKTFSSFSSILKYSYFNSIKSINQVSIPRNTITTKNHFSSITNLYTKQQISQPLKTQVNFYNTNQNSCNIQNAYSTGIESNNDKSKDNESSKKKFNNSETPFDIRHEGALTPMEKLLMKKLVNAFEPTAVIKVKDISGNYYF